MTEPVRLAITLGDPRGIGPEIVRKALARPEVRAAIDPVIVGPSGTEVVPDECVGAWSPTHGDEAEAGRLAGWAIGRAVALATTSVVKGIVTAPIDKHALHAGGFDYPGHTEMLGALTGSHAVMMLAATQANGHPLRVILATTHIPLRDVPRMLTPATVIATAEIARRALIDWYDIAEPRIALCALNPHGGDGGRFGAEDVIVLAPAARAAKIAGPYPADTVFVRALRGEFDAVIAPYHDVGMTAIKVASFGHGVNVTLGLPFPRTSPDHGTALDIAGRNVASEESMVVAMLECARIASRAS